MSSFGVLIPGRPVDTSFQQVEANKFLITIANAESINHVVVFLTGLLPLPHQTAACIFFSLPDASAAPTWHYLGHLSADKPSAIYKLTNLTQCRLRGQAGEGPLAPVCGLAGATAAPAAITTLGTASNGCLAFNYAQAPVLHAQVGISIEPLAVVSQLVPATQTSASSAHSFAEFVNKTVSNLYNYCTSFSKSASELVASQNPFQSQAAPGGDTQYVPLKAIQTWYETYTRRLSNDSDFWKSLSS